ncbi:hypothetical protein Tco_1502040 [Tanacetum coccineum]
MSSQGCQIIPVDFFFNNDLEYLRGGSNDKKYTAFMTKSKAARYELKGIEDIVPNLWSPVKVVYDRYALLGISNWQTKRQNFYGYIAKMVSKHDVYSTMRILSIISVKVNEWYMYGYLEEIVVKRVDQKLYTFKEGDFKRLHLNDIEDILLLITRVEDLQLGVESYQKKLNLTKPSTRDVDMSHRPAYTTLSNPQGVIYEDKLKQKRFMWYNELHKFSDDTLISVRDTLDQMLHELHLGNEVLKLKNFKKDENTSFQEHKKYEHVGPKVTSTQDGKRSQDDDKRFYLADDLKKFKDHMQVKLKGTSSSLKSKDHYAYHKLKDKDSRP